MNRTESLAAEIEAAEQKFLGKPAPKPATEDKPEGEQKVEPAKATVKPEVKPEDKKDEPTVQPSLSEEEETYKSRFAKFKASADATIHGLRQQVIYQDEEMQKLQKTVEDLGQKLAERVPDTVPDDLFTDEEKDMIGEETLAAMKKYQKAFVESKLKPLEDKLKSEQDKWKDLEKRRIEQEKENMKLTFLQKLERIVPNYRAIDTNPKFIEWMKGPDELSGYPRVNIFKAAQSAGDVGRVAEFFKAFEELSKPKDKLADKVTPTGTGAPTPQQKPQRPGDRLTLKQIEKFYDDVSRGRYRNRQKERQEMEIRIDNHLRKYANMDRK